MTYAITDRYNLLRSILAHDKKQPTYENDNICIENRPIPKHDKKEALEALGDTFNFIEIWLILLEYNYDARCVAYSNDMKEMLKQRPTTINKQLSLSQKVDKLLIEIGGGW